MEFWGSGMMKDIEQMANVKFCYLLGFTIRYTREQLVHAYGPYGAMPCELIGVCYQRLREETLFLRANHQYYVNPRQDLYHHLNQNTQHQNTRNNQPPNHNRYHSPYRYPPMRNNFRPNELKTPRPENNISIPLSDPNVVIKIEDDVKVKMEPVDVDMSSSSTKKSKLRINPVARFIKMENVIVKKEIKKENDEPITNIISASLIKRESEEVEI